MIHLIQGKTLDIFSTEINNVEGGMILCAKLKIGG